MTSRQLHILYLSLIFASLVIGLIAVKAWVEHAKSIAARDADIAAKQSEITDIKKQMMDQQAETQAKLTALEKQKQAVIAAPQTAPDVWMSLLKQLLPQSAAVQQTNKVDSKMPDAPSAVLTNQNQLDLAQAALSCKACFVERTQLKTDLENEKKIELKKDQELEDAKKASKGGSVWQRTKKVLKMSGCAGLGAAAGSLKGSTAAAVGAVAGSVACSF